MKRLLGLLAGLAVIAAIVGFAGYTLLGRVLQQPVLKAARVEVPKGSTFSGALRRLEDQGVIDDARLVGWAAKLQGLGQVQTGTYQLEESDSIGDALAKLARGKVKLERFTIAEGLNRWQIRDLLVSKGWLTRTQFDALCDDTTFLKQQKVPGPNCDGYLFPETYSFARGVSPRSLLSTIFSTYRRNYTEATANGRGPLNLGENQFMTLASIVEKETGAAHERPRIACVFYNRLQAKPVWRLQTDPTVIYAAHLEDPNFDGNIKRYHLRQMENPYNTYKNVGLPPGPIASPGRAAMRAVAQPGTCGDFFFVSKNNGEHIFCPTLECHETAVQKWQIEYFRKKRAGR